MMSFWPPILISLKVTLAASVIAFVFAVAAAWWMSARHFHGKLAVETLLLLPLVLPPTVVGFGLLVIFGTKSWAGRAIEWLFQQPIVFTWWAAVVAATVVAFPLVYQTIRTGFEAVDPDLQDVARSFGALDRQVFRYVTLPLSWRFLLSGYLLGFARAIGEFGATLMFAGSIPGKTETIPTAIFMAVESGNTRLAVWWVVSIVLFSFVLLAVIHRLRREKNS